MLVVALLLGSALAAEAESERDAAEAEAEPAVQGAVVEPSVPLLKEYSAEEAAKQPFGLVRTLQSVQDQVAHGSAAAHVFQRQFLAQLNEELRGLPPEVWDDPRNARAAVIFVLSGGDPRLVNGLLSSSSPPPIDERLLKASLAFGEGRAGDAVQFFDALDVRSLDPGMAGLVALIHATLVAKRNPKRAIALFDDARLLAPGTLVEEAALRQEILLLAREGDFERFDKLSSQYTRRFAKSLYATNFRRQFFAGVARQDFKGTSEWISRTEAELLNLAPGERGTTYLSIAEQATLGGNVVIARFAASNAARLTPAGSEERERAKLYEGAALSLTEDYEKGLELLNGISKDKLRPQDREVHDAALAVARKVYKWPVAPAESAEPPPASVKKAQELMSQLDSMLGEVPQ
jgi:chemotaxis protein MotC